MAYTQNVSFLKDLTISILNSPRRLSPFINFIVKIKWVFHRAPQFLSFPHPRAA